MWGRIHPHAVFLILANIVLRASCKGSLTFLIDDTSSMSNDITQVKSSVNRLVFNEKSSLISNMVLVTFNDPDAQVRAVTDNRNIFERTLDAVYAHNIYNPDCWEPSMKGLLLALEKSNSDSYIYVFTDAPARDYQDGRYVKELCQKKQSQIVFVLTGRCFDHYDPQAFDVYFDIAHACSGLAFDVTKSDVEQVLRTIEETIRGNKTVITSTIVPARVKKAIPFTIDDHTDYAIVSVSGRNVYLDVKGPSANLEKIMWNNNGKVVKLSNAKPGTYVATVMGQTKTSVVIVGRTDFFFTHGFSELKPKSLVDTSLQPIADAKVHLSIAVTDDHHTVKITSAQILDINENPTKSPVPLTEISKDFYVTDPFVAPSQRFKIAVNGIVKATGKPIKRMVKIPITPAAPPKILPTNTKPTVAIAEGKAIEIEYNSTVKLTCKVVAFPEPKIQWINYNRGLMPSKMSVQEYPYKYISYMDISYASKGDRYKCYAVNDVGRDDTTINVVVKDPFTFKSTPSGITKLTYGTEGTITCDVTSRIPMDIHWFYANEITGQTRAIEKSDKYVVSASRTQLTIKNMDLDLVGRYTCKVSLKNKKDVFKSFNTRVKIDGLIAPKVQGGNEIKVTKGTTAIIECKVVRGLPAPKITWLFGGKSGSTFTTLAGSETVLRITNVEDKHEGKYKCIGENVAGKDEHVTTLFVQDIPKILPTSSMVYQATEGDALLRIPCVAAGVPKPVIVWKLSGHYITPSAKYSTEDGALIIRNPKVSDTNLYTCEAKNEAGAVSATFKTYIRQAPQVSGVAAKKVRIGTPASVECKLISCDKSFTIVLDTTKSMREELDIIKVNLPTAINASYNTDITNYILVPFNDPDVGVPTVVLTPRELLTSLNAITVSGGHKCPENSLAGIEKALQVSKHKSNIFVFTDAYAKDVSKLSSIENLCRNTRSQVVIFLSGFCSSQSSATVNEQVYYDVAKACSGAVVHFDPATLRQAFKYIKEVMNVEWTDVISYDTFTEYKELPFTVDSFTKTVLLVVSGDNPRLEVSTPDGSESTVEKVLDTRHSQVVRLTNPSIGVHKATIRCRNKTSIVLYKRYELPLRFGFSTKLPRSMSETSRRPMPGRNNKILIDATQSKIKLETIEIQVANEKEKKALVFGENSSTGMYMTETFIDPGKTFCIWVKGYDTSTNQEIKGSSEFFIPQSGPGTDSRWTKPQSEILDAEPLVDYGTNATFACKVTGYPEPTILWEDDAGVTLPSESVLIEIPALYISYVSIENVTVNSTIYCKTKNSEGEASHSLNLYVNRPYTFDVIQTPADQTIEYGSEGKLYCEVIAYPAAEAKWYHNDTEVTPFDDLQIDQENKALWIKNMTVSNVGEYKCELKNEANIKTYSALVTISGIEVPQVEVEKASMTLKLGDWSDLECRIIKGKPSPAITWTFKSENGFEFRSLPDGVVADDGKLKIASAQPEHKGVYRCDAANIEGHHSADITVQLQYPPSISKDAEPRTVTVKEEDDVVLPCEVDASPAASVRWEMSQDDVIMVLDDRHRTDRRHTHRFKALWKDSGNYHCIAQNNIGTAEKIISVNVLVAPYIEAPKVKNVVARTGDNVVLSCNVLYGNPVPSSKWEFIAPDSTTKVLKRSNSSSALHLNNVSYTNEGSYLCIADNDVGTDSVNIYVKIQ